MTALECYKLLLNDYVSPALRERHFMGSVGKYELPHENAFIQIGFQKDKWSTKDEIGFKIDISVTSKAVWAGAQKRDSWIGHEPALIGVYPVKMWRESLAMIPFIGRDKWWKVTTESDLSVIANDIIKRIDKHALPKITKELDKLHQ